MKYSPSRTIRSGLAFVTVLALGAAGSGIADAATLTALYSFGGPDGANPVGGLIADAAGNLFGTTEQGGMFGAGSVFAIVKIGGGFASTYPTLASFHDTNGAFPTGGLIADATGNLFGTTEQNGPYGYGTVFEIAKISGGFAMTPTTLASFNYANGANPFDGLIADAAGNLFGTTYQGGMFGAGTVFEIAKTSGGFAGSPTTLLSFDGANGANPAGGLIADATGNLFGTTQGGGAFGYGTVFEIARNGGGFASEPTALVSYNNFNGANPIGGLIADSAGNLFGTTAQDFAGLGTVFEIVKTGGGFANEPTTLTSFNYINGTNPYGGLIADAAGNLFGTTSGSGAHAYGTVFEIANTGSGYDSTPITLASFDNTNTGKAPGYGALIADNAGNLFGTAPFGGTFSYGTVFEVTNSGFQTAGSTVDTPEPASLTLLGAGLLSLAAARRRWARRNG